jgi:hypothetical protein
MISSSRWRRVNRHHPCPICGRPDWCLFTGTENDPDAAICPRVESPKRCGEAGWLHRMRDDLFQSVGRQVIRAVSISSTAPRLDLAALSSQYRIAVNPEALDGLARYLGLSVESLTALGIGWSTQHWAWSFPMSDANGNVLGIRLRRPNGFKFAVRGSKDGLFILEESETAHSPLLIAEGPTDVAALWDMGFRNVAGRPSCTGGIKLLCELVRRRRRPEVVIIADRDTPGQHGAEDLASVLLAYSSGVCIITPPDGIKDARAWLQAGVTRQYVQQAINSAPVRRLILCGRATAGGESR